jgi:Uma2 family endonuclease
MSLAHQENPRVTPELYLTLERQASDKNEYLDGVIVATGGSSPEHDLVVTNLQVLLYNHVGDGPSRTFTSNFKVRTARQRLFSYPDLTIVCGEPLYHDAQRDVLTNPQVIFEVLSPSTEDFDRGKKRVRYQTIETLTDYLLVAQNEPRVEHWRRQPGNLWLVGTVDGLESTGPVIDRARQDGLSIAADRDIPSAGDRRPGGTEGSSRGKH